MMGHIETRVQDCCLGQPRPTAATRPRDPT